MVRVRPSPVGVGTAVAPPSGSSTAEQKASGSVELASETLEPSQQCSLTAGLPCWVAAVIEPPMTREQDI